MKRYYKKYVDANAQYVWEQKYVISIKWNNVFLYVKKMYELV